MVAAVAKCKRCKADIVWLKTAKGAWMPVDAGTAKAGETFDLKKGHIPHWSTCPDAKSFKKVHPKLELPESPPPPETYEQLEQRLRAKGVIK